MILWLPKVIKYCCCNRFMFIDGICLHCLVTLMLIYSVILP